MAASHDHSLALRLSRIVAHANADIRAILIQIVQYPGRAQRLYIESQGQPPPDAALQLIGKCALFEELSADTLMYATGFDKIMNVEAFGFTGKAPVGIPRSGKKINTTLGEYEA